jgi:hypothetical protein
MIYTGNTFHVQTLADVKRQTLQVFPSGNLDLMRDGRRERRDTRETMAVVHKVESTP